MGKIEGTELDEIAAMLGETTPAMMTKAAERVATLLAISMGFQRARVHVRILDLGMPGKIGMSVGFDPDLNPVERAEYLRVFPALMRLIGTRPPILVAEA
jgi:hypothetical protein